MLTRINGISANLQILKIDAKQAIGIDPRMEWLYENNKKMEFQEQENKELIKQIEYISQHFNNYWMKEVKHPIGKAQKSAGN